MSYRFRLISVFLLLLISHSYCNDDFGDKLFEGLDSLDFNEQLSKLDDMIHAVDETIGIETVVGALSDDDCRYECEKGASPVPKKNHKRTFNGCGAYGIEMSYNELPEMTVCCNYHDICYDTCNSNRDQCDKDFKICLQKICEKKKNTFTTKEMKYCRNGALLMYTGTTALGCTPYLEAQKKACTCVKTKESHQERKADRTSTKQERMNPNSQKGKNREEFHIYEEQTQFENMNTNSRKGKAKHGSMRNEL